jgi:hypothetical protein
VLRAGGGAHLLNAEVACTGALGLQAEEITVPKPTPLTANDRGDQLMHGCR